MCEPLHTSLDSGVFFAARIVRTGLRSFARSGIVGQPLARLAETSRERHAADNRALLVDIRRIHARATVPTARLGCTPRPTTLPAASVQGGVYRRVTFG